MDGKTDNNNESKITG